MVSLSNHTHQPGTPSFDKLRMSGVVRWFDKLTMSGESQLARLCNRPACSPKAIPF